MAETEDEEDQLVQEEVITIRTISRSIGAGGGNPRFGRRLHRMAGRVELVPNQYNETYQLRRNNVEGDDTGGHMRRHRKNREQVFPKAHVNH